MNWSVKGTLGTKGEEEDDDDDDDDDDEELPRVLLSALV